MEYVARKSNLVVPEGFVELDREEMTYVDGGFFVGFSASASTCVSVWNSVCTSAACRAITGTTVLGLLLTATKAYFPVLYGKVVGVLEAAWGKFCSLFTAGGPLGWIIGIGIGLAGATAIGYVAGMIVCGAMGCGFKVGLEIGWFNVSTVCTYTY